MAIHQRAITPLKIFFDASALFAAAYSPTGASRELLVSGPLITRRLVLVSDFVLEEAYRNLRSKSPEGISVLKEILEGIDYIVVPEPTRRQVLAASRVVHWKDAPVVSASTKAHAHYLVTYDRRDLLEPAAEIESAFGLKVVTPGDLLTLLREESEN